MTFNIKIIGIGAGGSHLSHFLAQHLNFHSENSVITLIDGKSFRMKNYKNQRFLSLGNKARVKKDELRFEFQSVRFRSIEKYVNEDNIAELIDENDIIFCCVDNHGARSLINQYCQTLDNVVLINGGVEDTDGDVCIYIREKGKDITPDLTYKHPEIANPQDEVVPDEGANCDEVAESDSARLLSILTVVNLMFMLFNNYVEKRIDYYEIYFDTATCAFHSCEIPDIYKQKI